MKIINNAFLKFVLFVVFIVGTFALGKVFSVNQETINPWLTIFPFWAAALIFFLLYIIGTFVVWYLKDPLKVVGAIFFGAYISSLLIYLAEIVNACIFFRLSSVLGRDFVKQSLKGKLQDFYEKIATLNFGWIFVLRAVPLVPFRVQDLSFGLSKLPLRKYLLAVIVASPPRIFWIQLILAAVKGLSVDKMYVYFLEQKIVMLISFFYFIAAAILAFSLKKRITNP